jgi:branched-chain amino acid transport system permease protein
MNAMKPVPELVSDHSVSSHQDRSQWLGFGIFIVITALLPFVIGQYYLYVVTQVMIYAIATLGLDVLYGRTGQLSLSPMRVSSESAHTLPHCRTPSASPLFCSPFSSWGLPS